MSRFERACILCLVCSAYLITLSCQVHVSRFHGSCSGPMLSSRKDGESVMFMQRMLAAISAQQGGRVSRVLDAVFLSIWVVPFCTFYLGVSLSKLNSRKKGTLIIKGLLANLGFGFHL